MTTCGEVTTDLTASFYNKQLKLPKLWMVYVKQIMEKCVIEKLSAIDTMREILNCVKDSRER